jgi:hypothetical protein
MSNDDKQACDPSVMQTSKGNRDITMQSLRPIDFKTQNSMGSKAHSIKILGINHL